MLIEPFNPIIEETDENGISYPGFKSIVQLNLKRINATPIGKLLITLVSLDWNRITIRPGDATPQHGGATTRPDGQLNGVGRNALITLDTNLGNETVKVTDRDNRLISEPVYMIIAHELIHALRMPSGEFAVKPANDPAYVEQEEEIAISTGVINENIIRFENGLDLRYGIFGIDSRFGER